MRAVDETREASMHSTAAPLATVEVRQTTQKRGSRSSRSSHGDPNAIRNIVRIDPATVIRDQIATLFAREASIHDDPDVDEADVLDVTASVVVRKDEPQAEPPAAEEELAEETHAAVRPQRMSIEEAPIMLGSALDYTPLPLTKCEPPATIEEMRPPQFEVLDGKPTPVPVPTGSADITKEWCTLAFRYKGRLGEKESVTSLTMKPLGGGEGEFSDLYLVNVVVDGGKPGAAPKLPRTLVAKFSPPDMSAIELAAVFSPEAHFYNDTTVAAGGLTRPDAIYVGYLKKRCGGDVYCIIMESAAGSKEMPSVCFKRVDGCGSADHIVLVMRSLARFHARWWQATQSGVLKVYSHPDKAGGPLPHFPRCVAHGAFVLMFKNGLKALPACFSDNAKYKDIPKFGEEYKHFIAGVRPALRRRRHAVIRELYKHPLTLIHGDAHLENIFFGEQYEGGCTFIDFGLLMFGPAMGDVATVIGGGMPVEARRQHEEMLVKCYHDSLTMDFGVTGYSFDECWKDYKFQLVRPFFQLLIMAPGLARQRKRRNGMFAPTPSEGSIKLAQMYVQLNTRFSTALMDHKWKEQVEAMPFTAGSCRPCW